LKIDKKIKSSLSSSVLFQAVLGRTHIIHTPKHTRNTRTEQYKR